MITLTLTLDTLVLLTLHAKSERSEKQPHFLGKNQTETHTIVLPYMMIYLQLW